LSNLLYIAVFIACIWILPEQIQRYKPSPSLNSCFCWF